MPLHGIMCRIKLTLVTKSRWARADDVSDDEEEEEASASARKESAAQRSARVNAEIKSNLTAILLDVTDAIFGARPAALCEVIGSRSSSRQD